MPNELIMPETFFSEMAEAMKAFDPHPRIYKRGNFWFADTPKASLFTDSWEYARSFVEEMTSDACR